MYASDITEDGYYWIKGQTKQDSMVRYVYWFKPLNVCVYDDKDFRVSLLEDDIVAGPIDKPYWEFDNYKWKD